MNSCKLKAQCTSHDTRLTLPAGRTPRQHMYYTTRWLRPTNSTPFSALWKKWSNAEHSMEVLVRQRIHRGEEEAVPLAVEHWQRVDLDCHFLPGSSGPSAVMDDLSMQYFQQQGDHAGADVQTCAIFLLQPELRQLTVKPSNSLQCITQPFHVCRQQALRGVRNHSVSSAECTSVVPYKARALTCVLGNKRERLHRKHALSYFDKSGHAKFRPPPFNDLQVRGKLALFRQNLSVAEDKMCIIRAYLHTDWSPPDCSCRTASVKRQVLAQEWLPGLTVRTLLLHSRVTPRAAHLSFGVKQQPGR